MKLITAAAALTFGLAACASSSTTSRATTAATATTIAATTTTAVADVPHHIVSLSPTGTEMLYAIGAGDQVAAIDDQSDYPPESQSKKSSLSGFTPNIEAISTYHPDLVVISDDSQHLSAQLGKLGIKVWVGAAAATFDDAYQQIHDLGVATGHAAAADALVSSMKQKIEAAVSGAPKASLTYYHELDNTFFSLTSNTFAGRVYSLFGLTNIADGQPGGDYPQLSSEYIVKQSPSLIFLADSKCCGQDAKQVAARPGWSPIAAVKQGHIVTIDDDVASRWGPRLVDFVTAVAAAVQQAAPKP